MSAIDDRFDAGLRAHHAAAVARVTPATRAQLAQRRHAALRGDRPRATHGMRYGLTAFAALCALAVGLQLRQPESPAAQASLAGVEATPRPDTLLDEDPEFYAWLASTDARLVAME